MNATLLYRIACVVLVVFAAGHTFGFLKFRPASAEGLAVHDAMNNVHIDIKGSSFTYGDFYTGFGLMVTAYLLFAAFLAWHLGTLAREQPMAIGALGWAFVAVQAVCVAVSLRYFFLLPSILSIVIVICLAWAAWLAGVAKP